MDGSELTFNRCGYIMKDPDEAFGFDERWRLETAIEYAKQQETMWRVRRQANEEKLRTLVQGRELLKIKKPEIKVIKLEC